MQRNLQTITHLRTKIMSFSWSSMVALARDYQGSKYRTDGS